VSAKKTKERKKEKLISKVRRRKAVGRLFPEQGVMKPEKYEEVFKQMNE
jgi:hypothetical protein